MHVSLKNSCTDKCIEIMNIFKLGNKKAVSYVRLILTSWLEMTKSVSGGSFCNDDTKA